MRKRTFNKRKQRIIQYGNHFRQKQELKALKDSYKPKRDKSKVSNLMLVVSVSMVFLYIFANFVLMWRSGICLDASMTTGWFAFWTVEIFALMGIKVSKVMKYGASLMTNATMDMETNDITDDEIDDDTTEETEETKEDSNVKDKESEGEVG